MTGRFTQNQRVIRLLRQRGERGITAADFLLPDVADGGLPIARLAARIDNLRGRDHYIVTEDKRGGFSVYVLRDQRPITAAAPAAPGPGDRLLQPPPRPAVFGWDHGAA